MAGRFRLPFHSPLVRMRMHSYGTPTGSQRNVFLLIDCWRLQRDQKDGSDQIGGRTVNGWNGLNGLHSVAERL
jgi:hypothetical protein